MGQLSSTFRRRGKSEQIKGWGKHDREKGEFDPGDPKGRFGLTKKGATRKLLKKVGSKTGGEEKHSHRKDKRGGTPQCDEIGREKREPTGEGLGPGLFHYWPVAIKGGRVKQKKKKNLAWKGASSIEVLHNRRGWTQKNQQISLYINEVGKDPRRLKKKKETIQLGSL